MTTGAPAAVSLPTASRSTALPGVLLFAGAAAVLMGIITAEALYPVTVHYNTHTSSVSDLAAMRPDNVVRQPSAMVFNATMVLAGLAFAVSVHLLQQEGHGRRLTIPLAFLGLGMIGVGLVPGNHLALHTLFAMIAFVSGGVGALLTAKSHAGPLRVIFRCLGIVSLTSLAVGTFLIEWAPVARLGEGGAERWVIYPVILWVIALSVVLLTANERDAGEIPRMRSQG
ncbi:MAG TPA: DUF998 domain-containing protein [Jatrophihabitans sp.]|jgi:hypothetical membrane protein|uniref:DUF998 domain-containing protein n=1 Tax=Jatrophihabitans sp. TaxID=1932789 RepID=UPI002EDC0C32